MIMCVYICGPAKAFLLLAAEVSVPNVADLRLGG